jgi:mannan endo-1,4-beta-mannosidase
MGGSLRPVALNVLTCAATLTILAALALPARSELARRDPAVARNAAAAPAPLRPAGHPRRVFGVYVDPWHVDDWARAVGAAPQAIAKFEAFSRDRGLGPWLAETRRRHIRRLLVTWEPWAPVPAALGALAQARRQRGYRNIDVARGAQDRYMFRFARSLAAFHGTVYLRYAHEMNGYWYPWSRDPRAYRWAWQRMVRIFRLVGARNVRFVWSVNPNLYEPRRVWLRTLRRYWPGAHYVDDVGSTMIDFGGTKDYPVAQFLPRLRVLRERFGKPVVLTETNTDFAGRVAWLRHLRAALRGMPWIRAVMWSQLPSRGGAHRSGDGFLDWDVQQDPVAAQQLAGIVEDGVR